jgi:anti-sigma B factor antagonist
MRRWLRQGWVVRISVRFKDDISILSLSGKFVAGSDGPFLRQKVKDLLDAGSRKLLFNFADVPYIDSTGLGFLAGSRELAAEASAQIILCGINPHVRRILDGVKLSQFFETADDEGAGLARLQQTAQPTTGRASKKQGRARSRPAGADE